MEWLQLHGAGSISLLGDSSGGTQVMETLLLLAHRQNLGQPTVKIDAAVCFSAWLDLTCANPGQPAHTAWCCCCSPQSQHPWEPP